MNTCRLHFLLLTLILSTSISSIFGMQYAYKDSLTFTQPDVKKTSFDAYRWGDHFLWHMETTSGYAVIQKTDGYYHYATLGKGGYYIPTTKKVGIDSPPGGSYHLDRSALAIAALEDSVDAYNDALRLRDEWWLGLDSIRLGIALVEFADRAPYENEFIDRENGFLIEDYENMLFAPNHEYDTEISGKRTPGERRVHGSMRDFYMEQTDSVIIIYGNVMNPTIGDTLPVWYSLNDSVAHYSANYGGLGFRGILDSTGVEDSLVINGGAYDAIAVVYADAHMGGTRLNPRTWFEAQVYLTGEKSGRFDDIGGIGIHCHEFGHDLGFWDLRKAPIYYMEMRGGQHTVKSLNTPGRFSFHSQYRMYFSQTQLSRIAKCAFEIKGFLPYLKEIVTPPQKCNYQSEPCPN